jgi:phage gpG-like protein
VAEIVRIQVDSALLDAALNRVIARIERPVELLHNMGAVMERNIELRFITKEDPTGVPWQALADSTIKSYKHKYGGSIPGSLLERSREMLNSLGYNVTGISLEIGFGVAYAGYHITGTKSGKLPRRDPLTADWRTGRLGPGDEADLVAEIESYLASEF